jgi:hypothetical protein
MLPNRGYMYVTVSSDKVQVDYIRTYMPSEENATRKNGDVAYSYTIVPSTVTGVNDIIAEELIKVFPNPVNNKLYINYNTSISNYDIKVLSLSGELVLSTKSREIDTNRLPNGMYFLIVETDKFIVNKQIVIQH